MNVLKELDLFLKDPVKQYVAETVDLFLMALAMALCVEVTLFQINKEGEVAEMDVGVQEHSSLKFLFARTQARHRFFHNKKENTNQSAPKIQHESTETEKITTGSISDERKNNDKCSIPNDEISEFEGLIPDDKYKDRKEMFATTWKEV